MRDEKFPLPDKYSVYSVIYLVLGIIFVVNVFNMDKITGEKEYCNFTHQDWCCFVLFLLIEILLVILICFFFIKAQKLHDKYDEQVKQYLEKFKYAGIRKDNCDYIWVNFNGEDRARIIKSGDAYCLYIERFEYKTEAWYLVDTVSDFHSLAEIKKALFYEFYFYCEENTVLSRHGNKKFRDEH